MLKTFILALLTLALCPALHASTLDGNELLKSCRQYDKPESAASAPDDTLSLGFCLGYVAGVTNALLAEQATGNNKGGGVHACFPQDGITNNQAALIVIKRLKDNPGMLHLPAGALVMWALAQDFPCKK